MSGMINNQKAIFAALAVSVVLNAGLVGFMAARMTGEPDKYRTSAPFVNREALGQLGLAEQQLQAAREVMRERRAEYHEQAAELREIQQVAAELLRAEEFNEAALREAFAEIRRIHAETEQLMQDSVIELARDMDPRARERLASYIARQARLRKERPPRRHPPRDAPPPEDAPRSDGPDGS